MNTGRSQTRRAKRGDRVRVEYSGEFKEEKAGLRRLGREILEFTIGSRDVMPGINRAVIGMLEGERKQLTLTPRDAYGEFRPQLIREIPRDRFPAAFVLKVGKQVTMVGAKSRRRRKATIVTLNSAAVVIDSNHPLAGKTLDVELQLLVRYPSPQSPEPERDIGGEA